MSKAIVVNNIRPRSRIRNGEVIQYQGGSRDNLNAVVLRNESIRIYGVYAGRPFDITFRMGDTAEYDSYNLKYLGAIQGITDKGVLIKPRYSNSNKRLDLYTFCWRNYNFDLERITAENTETSYSI
jgi:hypothetical protein